MDKKTEIAEHARFLIGYLQACPADLYGASLLPTLYTCRAFLKAFNVSGTINEVTEKLIKEAEQDEEILPSNVQKLINALDEMAQILVGMRKHQLERENHERN